MNCDWVLDPECPDDFPRCPAKCSRCGYKTKIDLGTEVTRECGSNEPPKRRDVYYEPAPDIPDYMQCEFRLEVTEYRTGKT